MRWAFGAWVCVLLLGTPAAATPRCLTEREAAAEKVQSLQSGLMVAALKCVHKPELFLWERYQMFISQFGPELQTASDQLQDWFDESYGAHGTARYEAYVTGLANDYSLTTFGQARYCEAMSALALDALGLSAAQLNAGAFDTDLLSLGKVDGCVDDPEGSTQDIAQAVAFVPELRAKPDVPDSSGTSNMAATEHETEPDTSTAFSEETIANGERITIVDE